MEVRMLFSKNKQNHMSKSNKQNHFFLGKITSYVASKLERVKMCLFRKYILLRDQAFFKLQFFSGGRTNDLGLCLSQEVQF